MVFIGASSFLALQKLNRNQTNTANKEQGYSTENALINTAEAKENTTATLSNKMPISGVTNFVSSALQIYRVAEGDTLSGIAAKFGVKTLTLQANNNLQGNILKVGMTLTIPPDDSVLVKTKTTWNWDKAAQNLKTTKEQLLADNLLSEKDELPEVILCHQCAEIKTAQTQKIQVASLASIEPVSPPAGSNEFPKGNCTYYVARKMLIKFSGHAKNWPKNARAAGYKTGSSPIAGSAVVTNDNPIFGHVAFVEQVKGDTILVSEMNYEQFGAISKREIRTDSKSIVTYIYPLEQE